MLILCSTFISRLDSGSHFYDTYETLDGRYMAVGAVEPHFYHEFVTLLGLNPDEVGQFDDFDEMKLIIQKRFKERTQEDWCKVAILLFLTSSAFFSYRIGLF